MRQPRPLPRSLIPLPGESLPGFLLRLSCRLNQPPARIAELTGLVPDGRSGAHLPVILLAGIPEPASSAFARLTRLDGSQVTQLGMASWQERYPPLIIAPESTARSARRLNGQVVFASATRYCPDCLAGDGSAIQDAFAGPWLKAWHLPVVFACPTHQRLLEHLCPECGQAAWSRRPGGHARPLLPAMLVAGLHPTQCRAEIAQGHGRHTACCGARLDQGSPRHPIGPELIALQRKILGLLDPNGPASTLSAGIPTRPDRYFADLRTLALLACSTWPAARNLSPSEEMASAIDQHVDSLRRQARIRQAKSPTGGSHVRPGLPPPDAVAGSGLASIADRILAGSRNQAREHLAPLLPPSTRTASRTRWGHAISRADPPCSNGLQAAADPLLRTFSRTGGRRDPVLRPERWGPENIPAILPEPWFTSHFTPIDGVNTKFARRAASLRLVQMTAGGSLGEAARFLGIGSTDVAWPGAAAYAATGRIHAGQHAFNTALKALARDLDASATPLVNYQRRRQALHTWCISEDNWAKITARLPSSPGPQQPDLGDRKRQVASVYVWTRVTSGEHIFAPRPIETTQPPNPWYHQSQWTAVWKMLDQGHPGTHYPSLKAELDDLATSLAKTIDTNHYRKPVTPALDSD